MSISEEEIKKNYLEMYELLCTIENDAGQIPDWLWKRIKNLIKKIKINEPI